MLYFQSMHNEDLRKNDRKENTYLIRVHIFFCKFSHRLTLSRSSFIQKHFFHKNIFFFLDYFQHDIFFISSFYSWQNIFFLPIFQLTPKIFFSMALVFSDFLSFIENKTLPYFEKETKWETIFLYFFKNWKHIFLFWQESNFLIMP